MKTTSLWSRRKGPSTTSVFNEETGPGVNRPLITGVFLRCDVVSHLQQCANNEPWFGTTEEEKARGWCSSSRSLSFVAMTLVAVSLVRCSATTCLPAWRSDVLTSVAAWSWNVRSAAGGLLTAGAAADVWLMFSLEGLNGLPCTGIFSFLSTFFQNNCLHNKIWGEELIFSLWFTTCHFTPFFF